MFAMTTVCMIGFMVNLTPYYITMQNNAKIGIVLPFDAKKIIKSENIILEV